MYTFELNNAKNDATLASGKVSAKSPVVEIFSAMVEGKDLAPFGKKADTAAKYIQELNAKAEIGDQSAMAEINTIRKFVIEPKLLQEIKLLGIFGNYTPLGFNETVEVETYNHIGAEAKRQTEGLDVSFPAIKKTKYQVPTQIVSGGYAVNYRQASLGDMTKENEGMEQVRVMIRNNASKYVIETVFNAIENATGIKNFYEGSTLAKASVDELLKKIRRFGKPNIVGDYAVISQFNAWAGYVGSIASSTITGVSQKILDEIAETGLLGMYNGSILSEIPNGYDLTSLNAAGTNFDTLLPQGLAFAIPQGFTSPVKTFSRGGLTSFTGNSVTTGDILTRFDLEIACDVAKGREYEIGIIHDSALDSL